VGSLQEIVTCKQLFVESPHGGGWCCRPEGLSASTQRELRELRLVIFHWISFGKIRIISVKASGQIQENIHQVNTPWNLSGFQPTFNVR
jgi:hypothetical protein